MISRNILTILTLAFVLTALSIFALACGGSNAQSNAKQANVAATPQAVEVTTAKAITRDLPRFLEATGSLAAEEQTDVAPAVGGKVVSVNVDLGSFVQKGAVLVRLDDRDARIRLEQATAQVAQAEAAVRQAEARIGLRPGQAFSPEQVADVRSARVALELAEKQRRATFRARPLTSRKRSAISCNSSTTWRSNRRDRTTQLSKPLAPLSHLQRRRSNLRARRLLMRL